MLSLEKIVRYVPAGRKALLDVVAENDALEGPGREIKASDVLLLKSVFGLRQVAQAQDESLLGLLDASLRQIVPAEPAARARIKYVFHCHSTPCVVPPGAKVMSELKAKYGISHAISIGIGQEQCSAPISLLLLCAKLLEREREDAQILIVMGELAFHPKLQFIPGASILGDASAACLVGKQQGQNQLLALAQRKFRVTDLSVGLLNTMPSAASDYGDELIKVVNEALLKAALSIDDISVVLVHNVNTISWKFFAKNFPCAIDKLFLENVAKIGHCFTADPFINYCDASEQGRLKKGDIYLMVSVGRRSTYAAAVFRY